MIKQYLSIKERYADAILFYRMGDFYEMFFEDAEVASRILEITLTSRNKKDEYPIPMCGVPYRAVQGYIARLINQGYKVAICDQIEDPALAKGLVKRDVVRVITPGMILDDELLDEKSDNYVLAVACEKNKMGLSYLDISTGTFRVTESSDLEAVVDEALRISPSEVLLPESSKEDRYFSAIVSALSDRPSTVIPDRAFDYGRGRERLMDQFKTVSLEGFGCEHLKAGVRAAGALVFYIRETQKQKTEHLSNIETYSLGNSMVIDEISFRNLEIIKNIRTGSRQGTLIGILLGRMRTLSVPQGQELIQALRDIPGQIEQILRNDTQIMAIAREYHEKNNFLYLGRGINYPVALEGALKLKEISYIHAEGYPAAEMKHGPIALIDENMPVVVIALKDPVYDKVMSNIAEVRARNGHIIAIATEGDTEIADRVDHVIYVPSTNRLLTPLLSVIPLQLLAYHIAVLRGCHVDQPRNLAKSVTVE